MVSCGKVFSKRDGPILGSNCNQLKKVSADNAYRTTSGFSIKLSNGFCTNCAFFYNLLHVNYHPYDSYYHDRLEFLSLVVSELTLFFGLLLNFMEADKNCLSGCLIPPVVAGARGTISGFIIFCNCLFLAYFGFGFMYHIHFLLPKN